MFDDSKSCGMGPWVSISSVYFQVYFCLHFRILNASSGNSFKLSARDIKDHVSVLNIDKPGKDGMYGLHKLEITGNYRSATGGQDIDLNGFDIEVLSGSRLRFWMVNNRPAVDDAGAFLDASKVGANSTIEIFEHKRGSKKLEFVKTIWSEAVPAPNNVAASGDGSVFVTNDHDNSAGRVHTFFPFSKLTPSKVISSGPFKRSSEQAPSHTATSPTAPAPPPSPATSNTPTESPNPPTHPTAST
jgi:hypothetical protein